MWHDFRQALRQLAKSTGFTTIAVMSIAFGTGANVAIFSAVDALLLRPLPVERPGDLLTIGSRVKSGVATHNVASHPDYRDIRDRARTFDGVLAVTSRTLGFSAGPQAPTRIRFTSLVSGNFFRVLGVVPILGRDFHDEEDMIAGRDAVTILSYGLWQTEFAGDPGAIGQRVRIGGMDFTVVGIAPESFQGIEFRDIPNAAYVPLAMWPRLIATPGIDPLEARAFRALTVKGRLRPGASARDARAELAAIGRDLERAHPDTNKGQTLIAQNEVQLRFERAPLDAGALVVLTILSIAVLAVACANVAGLLASRAPVRAREIALRLAIGAGRGRLIRQLILESAGIALLGTACGLAIGFAGIVALRQVEFPTEVVAVPVFQLNLRAMTFSLALATFSTFLFGVGPAIYTTHVDLASALKASDSSANRRERLTGRNALAAIQVALSLVMLTLTVYAVHFFRRELNAGPGFRVTHIAKTTMDVSQSRLSDGETARYFERAQDAARLVRNVRSASVVSAMPLFSFETTPIVPEGYRLPEGQAALTVCSNSIGESYFETLEIPLLAGRAFRAGDTAATPRVAIVNDTLAQHGWPGADAIGRRFRMASDGPWVEVVGVAKTTRYWYPGEVPQDAVYFPFRQRPRMNMAMLAATAGESAAALTTLHDALSRVDRSVPVYDAQTIERFYNARATSLAVVMTQLIGSMGIMGIVLTMVGLYGLVSYSVNRRTREIGIRIAIGASRGRVLTMVLRQGLMPAAAGLLIGMAMSVAVTRLIPLLAPFNYRYDQRWYFLLVPAILGIAVIASLVPARRAAAVDPTVALRCE